MKVKALRGVCVGPGVHLAPGDFADLDPALVTFLVHIKAVEAVRDEPPETPAPHLEPIAPPKEDPKPEPPPETPAPRRGRQEK